VMITLQPMNIVQAASDLLWSRVLQEFPLKFALSEGGIGWIPYFLERVDYVYQHHKAWTNADFGDLLPSQLFRERIITCFIDDAVGLEIRHHIGVENITWECDYPHSDSTWPHSPEKLAKQVVGIPDEEIELITHRNAMREFQYDPFSVLAREDCTVGALRAKAADVDVSERSSGKPVQRHEGPITILSLVERATTKKTD